MLHGGIDKFFNFGEANDIIELATNLGAAHAEDRPIEIDVLAAREFAVKSRPYLQQTRDPTTNLDTTFGRIGDTAHNFEERALACAVPSDNTNNLTSGDFKVKI